MNTTSTLNRRRTTGTHTGVARTAWKIVATAATLAGLSAVIASTASDTRTNRPLTTQTLIPGYPIGLSIAFGPSAQAAVSATPGTPATHDRAALGPPELSFAFGANAPAAVTSTPATPARSKPTSTPPIT